MLQLRLTHVAPCGAVLILCGAAMLLATCTGPSPDVKGPAYAFQSGSTISVTASNFPTSLQPCVQKAFDNWNNANATTNASGNGSGVKYNLTFGSPVTTKDQVNVYQVTYSSTQLDGTALNNPGVTGGQANAGLTARINAVTTINTGQTTCDQVTVTMAPEIGHTLGLGECSTCTDASQSAMFGRIPPFSVPPYLTGPSDCDNSTTDSIYHPPPPPPPDPPPGDLGGGGPGGGSGGISPIIVDISGHGFDLTSAAGGVLFDIAGTGHPVQMGWTAPGSNIAFLALPANDGLVHSGKELFGNFTSQPPSSTPNGFAALAVYDDPNNGGNGDGVVDAKDAVFASLRLWIDSNHDGVSQPEELYTLPSLGVFAISLKYKEDRRTDQYGNVFRFRAQVNPGGGTQTGRMAYDVFFFFVTSQPSTKNLLRHGPRESVRTCPVPTSTKSAALRSAG